MGKLFGSERFDPKFIVVQIWVLQSFFYLVQFLLSFLISAVFGIRNDLAQVLSAESLVVQDSYSLVFVMTNLICVPFLCAGIVYVVERTYKCLDFTVTVYFLHLVVVSGYSGVPLNLVWWGVNGICISVTVLLSEYLCMKIEQQEITLTFSSKTV